MATSKSKSGWVVEVSGIPTKMPDVDEAAPAGNSQQRRIHDQRPVFEVWVSACDEICLFFP
jgi:hypothetical protein